MDKQAVIERVCEEIRERLGNKYDIEDIRLEKNKKNNGIIAEGIVVKIRGCNTMPCIYTDRILQVSDEMLLDKAIDRLIIELGKAIENSLNAELSSDIRLEKS